MKFAVLLVFLGLLSSAAMAVTIVNYTSAEFDRFSSGYPGTPVPNTNSSFIGLDYDWSGVGWSVNDPTKSFAMISDQYFVYANHYGSAMNISFYSPVQAAVVTMAVLTSFSFQPLSSTLGVAGDLRIGMLANPIAPSLGITSYPVLSFAQSAYLGLPLFVYGHGPSNADSTNSARIGTNVLENFAEISGTGLARSYAVGYDFDSSPTGEAVLQGGDSGSPLFVPLNGSLAIVGTHTGIDLQIIPHYSYDTFIPDYLPSMHAAGIPFNVVPEPSRVLLMMIGLTCFFMQRQRRKVEMQSA